MKISAKLNQEKTFIKIENSCTGTFLLLNKEEAIKLRNDLNSIMESMG